MGDSGMIWKEGGREEESHTHSVTVEWDVCAVVAVAKSNKGGYGNLGRSLQTS